ncbi:MAG: carbamoyl phosphate synthase large subunit, partial [Henriciella sp.]
AFISVKESDKQEIIPAARELIELGFNIVATKGTAAELRANGLAVEDIKKVIEGQPNIVDAMINGAIDLVFNTTEGMQSRIDSKSLRRTAVTKGIPYFTTCSASLASVKAIKVLGDRSLTVRPIQSHDAVKA